MGVSSIRQCLDRRSRRDGEQTHLLGDPLEVVQHRVQTIGLDMLQHVDAHHHLGRVGRLGEFRDGRIVTGDLDFVVDIRRKGMGQTALPRPVIEQLRGAGLLYDTADKGAVIC